MGGAEVVERHEQGRPGAGEVVGAGEDFEGVTGIERGEGFVPEL